MRHLHEYLSDFLLSINADRVITGRENFFVLHSFVIPSEEVKDLPELSNVYIVSEQNEPLICLDY